MHEAKSTNTPMLSKFRPNPDSPPHKDPRHFRSLVGALQYLTDGMPLF